jgi:5-methylcytosine-specific restriction endonuclease McrA
VRSDATLLHFAPGPDDVAQSDGCALAYRNPASVGRQAISRAVATRNALVCPRCGGDLVPLEPIFGYFCGKCGWSLPTVQPMEAEAIRIDHVMVGFPQGEPRVQVMLSWKDGPLAEMGEDLWTSVESGASPVFIGRDMPSAALARLGANDVWWYAGLFWSTKELDLSPHVVTLAAAGWSEWEFRQQESLRRRGEEDARIAAAEEMAKEERRKARLAWADAKLSGDSARRQPIPRAVRYDVFKRDNGRCVECGSTFDLQFDHIIPVAMGGATSVENLQLLCSDCNLRKGANLG